MVLLAGFVLKSETFRDELGLAPLPYALWLAMVRYVSPLGILVIFVDALGLYQVSFATHWPVLLALLVLIAVIGEAISPRLRQALSAR
jgi:NSS family neurotransmitter:Na+ symporter